MDSKERILTPRGKYGHPCAQPVDLGHGLDVINLDYSHGFALPQVYSHKNTCHRIRMTCNNRWVAPLHLLHAMPQNINTWGTNIDT